MAYIYAERVRETSTTTGTGTINLAGAVVNYDTFVARVGNGNTCKFMILDANGAWERSYGTVTDASPDTLSRTLIASSTGSLLDLSAGPNTVFCDWSAQDAQSAYLFNVAGTDANTTMAIGQMYVVDMSAWATADRTYTLPATAAVGDRVGVLVAAGNASYELKLTAASGDTLNGIAGGTIWSRLFIVYECVIMRCTVANATWIIEEDGRIPMNGLLRLSTSTNATESANTYYYPTDRSGVWTAALDVGNICSASDGKITSRRACKARIIIAGDSLSNMVDQKYMAISGEINASAVNTIIAYGVASAATSGFRVNASRSGITFAVDDYIRLRYAFESGSTGLIGATGQENIISFTEEF